LYTAANAKNITKKKKKKVSKLQPTLLSTKITIMQQMIVVPVVLKKVRF